MCNRDHVLLFIYIHCTNHVSFCVHLYIHFAVHVYFFALKTVHMQEISCVLFTYHVVRALLSLYFSFFVVAAASQTNLLGYRKLIRLLFFSLLAVCFKQLLYCLSLIPYTSGISPTSTSCLQSKLSFVFLPRASTIFI